MRVFKLIATRRKDRRRTNRAQRMDQQGLLITIAIFVGLAAIALFIQAGTMYGTYKASRALRDSIVPLVPRVAELVETSQADIQESRELIADVRDKTNQVLDKARKQMDTIETVINDASARTRRQLEMADVVVDDVIQRTQQTVDLV